MIKQNLIKLFLSIFLCLFGVRGFACIPTVNLGDTISFCQGNSINLNAFNPNCSYAWSTGSAASSINITSSGTYWVTVSNNCGVTRDTVVVIVESPVIFNLGINQKVCAGSSYIIQAPFAPRWTYLWQDGSTKSYFQALQTGMYKVKITNSCGVFEDSIQLNFVNLPNVQIGPRDTVICNSNPITLSAGNPGYPVTWSTGHTTNSFSVGVGGTFIAKSSNVCGTARDTITVHYSKPPDLGDTIGLCFGGSITIDSKLSFGNFLWSTGSTNRKITVGSPGTYWLQYSNSCGVFSDTVVVVNTGPAIVDLGPDVTFCWGSDSVLLDAGYPGSNYSWYEMDSLNNFNLIDTVQSIWIDTAAVIRLGVDNGCGLQFDIINIYVVYQPLQFLKDTVGTCANAPVLLDAGDWGVGTTYAWSNGITTRTSLYNAMGNGSVTVSNLCGTISYNFFIRNAVVHNVNLGPNDTLCKDSLILSPGVNLGLTDEILWSTGTGEPTLPVNSSGTYWVQVKNACGTFTDTIDLVFLDPLGTFSESSVELCQGSSMLLDVGHQIATSYLWHDGTTTSSNSISTAGQVWVRAWNKCDTISDTMNFTITQPINLNLGPDQVICTPNYVLLSAQNLGADSIKWNTGSTNGILPVNVSGTYWVDAYNVCGVFRDSIMITVKSGPRNLLNDTAFCLGSNLVLDATQNLPNSSYSWIDGTGNPSITVATAGWYWVDITNDCGTIRDSVYVREEVNLPQINLGKDTIICQGTVFLDPGNFPGARYKWSNGSRANYTIAAQSGTYYVTISNTCNTVSDTIEVLITGPPQVTLGDEVEFCSGHTLILDAANPGCTYRWSTGESTQTIQVDTSGYFSVLIENDCGILKDSVKVIIEYPLEDLDLGSDTIICQGTQLVLNPGYPGVSRQWQNGSTNESYIVFQTGMYWVDLTNSCGVFKDSIFVEVKGQPVFNLGPDQFLCHQGSELTLSGPPDMKEYKWSNGGLSQEVSISQPGKYWLEISNECFSYTDTIKIIPEYPILMDLGPDTIVCRSDNYVLDPGINNYDVNWNDQSVSPTLLVQRTGWYSATAINSCGVFNDSVYIQVDTIIAPIILDSLICLKDTVTIDLTNYENDIIWFDGSTERVRSFAEEGVYSIQIFNKCGVFNRDFQIDVSNCDCPMYLANSFTPNGDNLNETYKVVYDCDIKDFSFEIFNRWGGRVFYTEDPTEEWDGTFKGQPAAIGVYSYRIYYKWNVYYLDRHETRFGHINLIR